MEITAAQWDGVFHCAVAERCAALAWLRSESRIRTSAPAAVVARWEAWVTAHVARVQTQLDTLGQVDQWLQAHGVASVVLKGIPLGVRLYGSWWARMVNDIDLYVPAAQCTTAAEVLRAIGWRHLRGASPQDIEFVKQVDGTPMMLELHGTLAGPWMEADRFPVPEQESATIRGHHLRVHAGSFVPAYLASHLLQHSERPLLWIVDFASLWLGMPESARDDAWTAARAARLDRGLAIAEEWVSLIVAIEKRRDPGALESLRREVLRPSPVVAFGQVARSASGAADLARVILQLLWPEELRAHPRTALRFWGARIRKRFLPPASAGRPS